MAARSGVRLAIAVIVVVSATSAVQAQTRVPSVSLSFGVDTTAADVGEIFHLVRTYLARPDTSAGARALWSASDPEGDLHLWFAYQGFPATVLAVTSATPGDSEYVIKVLYARADSTAVKPLALQRLYAVRSPGTRFGWLLSNALKRTTRNWPTHRSGRIVFHYAPGQRTDPARAARAAVFVDSVAAIFAVAPPTRLDCYVTASPDEYLRALGLDFFPLPSGRGTSTGGQTLSDPHIVLSGDPAQGEAYLHEFVHAVLGRRIGGGAMLGEGIPVWLGGSKGRSATEMYKLLAQYQATHPEVTLEAVVRGAPEVGPQVGDLVQATGALFADAVYRRGGFSAVRALLGTRSDPDSVLGTMRERLALRDAQALERWWRDSARAATSR